MVRKLNSLWNRVKAVFSSLAIEATEKHAKMKGQLLAHSPAVRPAVAGQRGSVKVEYVFGLVIVIVLITAVIKTIMDSVHDVDTSGWSDAEVALWAVVGIAIVGGIVYKIYKMMFGGK